MPSYAPALFACLGFREKQIQIYFYSTDAVLKLKALFAKQPISLERVLKATYVAFDFNNLLSSCESVADAFCN